MTKSRKAVRTTKAVPINAAKEVTTGKPLSQAQKIAKAFSALRERGYFAAMDFMCCQSCGWGAVPEGQDKVVFYHDQDKQAFGDEFDDEHGDNKRGDLFYPLYIAWSGDAKEIIECLNQQGLATEWNGSPDTRIAILPLGGRKAYEEYIRACAAAESQLKLEQ